MILSDINAKDSFVTKQLKYLTTADSNRESDEILRVIM